MTLTVSAEKVAVGQRQCQGMERLAKCVLRLHGSLYVVLFIVSARHHDCMRCHTEGCTGVLACACVQGNAAMAFRARY